MLVSHLRSCDHPQFSRNGAICDKRSVCEKFVLEKERKHLGSKSSL